MARSKLMKKKKRVHLSTSNAEASLNATKVPILNLPAKFLWMKVKSGTKIRNVLKYSLKEFTNHNCVVWSAIGQGIGKVISCVEMFKKKLSGLHQTTKLRYVKSKKPSKEGNDENKEMDRMVPEIHILLTKNPLDTTEPGYQAPGISSMFQNSKVTDTPTKNSQSLIKTRMSSITAEEFAAMGLRTAQKRPWRENQIDISTKRTKKRDSSAN